jgi:hypothetical protein
MNIRLFSVLFGASLALVACKSSSTSSSTTSTGTTTSSTTSTGTTTATGTTTETGAGGAGGGQAQGGAGGAAAGGAGGSAAGGAGGGGTCKHCPNVLTDVAAMADLCEASKTIVDDLMKCACDAAKCQAECKATACAATPATPDDACKSCAQAKCTNEVTACANDM